MHYRRTVEYGRGWRITHYSYHCTQCRTRRPTSSSTRRRLLLWVCHHDSAASTARPAAPPRVRARPTHDDSAASTARRRRPRVCAPAPRRTRPPAPLVLTQDQWCYIVYVLTGAGAPAWALGPELRQLLREEAVLAAQHPRKGCTRDIAATHVCMLDSARPAAAGGSTSTTIVYR